MRYNHADPTLARNCLNCGHSVQVPDGTASSRGVVACDNCYGELVIVDSAGRADETDSTKPKEKKMGRIKLGHTGRDKITGFTGVVIGKTKYLTGDVQILIAQVLDQGEPWRDAMWFPAERIERTDAERVSLHAPGDKIQ